MSLATLIQLISSCAGIVGSLFFAIGIIRQNADAMAGLSGTYSDANPNMPPALAAQKADYVFGGSIIFLAFLLQFSSFLAPSTIFLNEQLTKAAPLIAITLTLLTILLLLPAAKCLAKHYEKQITVSLNKNWNKKRTKI